MAETSSNTKIQPKCINYGNHTNIYKSQDLSEIINYGNNRNIYESHESHILIVTVNFEAKTQMSTNPKI